MPKLSKGCCCICRMTPRLYRSSGGATASIHKGYQTLPWYFRRPCLFLRVYTYVSISCNSSNRVGPACACMMQSLGAVCVLASLLSQASPIAEIPELTEMRVQAGAANCAA